MNIKTLRQNGKLKEILLLLEESSVSMPYLDNDFEILVVEESEKPIIILNNKELSELWKRVVGSDESSSNK